MKLKKILPFALLILITGCSQKIYKNESFPDGDWHPVNPKGFGSTEAQNVFSHK